MNKDNPRYRRRVHYYETDQMGIVHHSNHIRWFEEARLDFMERAGFPYAAMEAAGILMPVTEVNCRYRRPIPFGGEVEVETVLASFNGVRAGFCYAIYAADGMTLLAAGSSGHCFVGRENRKPLNLKKVHPLFYEQVLGLIAGAETE